MVDQFFVLTPEKVVISYRIPGLATRAFGHIADIILAIVAAGAPTALMAQLGGAFFLGDAFPAIATLLSSIFFLAYFVLFEWLGQGVTPGKRASKLRVVMIDGTPITFAAALYRNLLRVADFLPFFYLLGFLVIVGNERSQRLGDMVAGTMIVGEIASSSEFSPAPYHVGIHQFESVVGDLRQMTLEDYQAIKRICDRSHILPPETLSWVCHEIWEPIAHKNQIMPIAGVHPIYLMEASVMKFGRIHNLL